MKLKKIIAAVAAAAIAVSTMAVTAFAADPVTVTLDSEYVGDWGSGATIKKEEFDKFEGDVKVVLTVEAINIAADKSYLLKPMDKDKGWDAITSQLTAEKATAKPDGFMQVRADQTEVEFVVPSAVAKDFWGAGLGFQVSNLIIKSATLSDGSKENDIVTVTDADTQAYCNGTFDPFAAETEAAAEETDAAETEAAPAEEEAAPAEEADEAADEDVDVDEPEADAEEETEEPEEEAAPAETEAPVAEEAPAVENTAAPATGNTAAAAIVTVMAVAGVAAVATKKRK